MTDHSDILILGQGIAGLFAACICADHGYQVKIIGKAAAANGAMQLAQNSYAALSSLSAETAAKAATQILDCGYRLDGIQLLQLENAHMLSLYSHPEQRYYAAVSRTDITEILTRTCIQHQHITFYPEFAQTATISMDRPAAQLVTQDGVLHQAEVILGADGVSGLSRQLISSAPLPQTAYGAMRAEVAADTLPGYFADRQTRLMLGNGCHLVSYPFAGGRKVNLVFCAESDALKPGWQQQFFASNPGLKMLADPQIDWHKTQIHSPFSSALWRYQRLTLIGDAAHMMPPHLAQGAGQSFEDIAMLDSMLSQYALGKALDEMAQARSRDAAKISQKAERTGKIMRLGGVGGQLRNQFLSLGGSELIESWMQDVWHR